MEDRDKVLNAIKKYLARFVPDTVKVKVLDDQAYQANGRWYVPVIPTPAPASMYSLYDKFADVEIELEDNDHLLVTLIPDFEPELAPGKSVLS